MPGKVSTRNVVKRGGAEALGFLLSKYILCPYGYRWVLCLRRVLVDVLRCPCACYIYIYIYITMYVFRCSFLFPNRSLLLRVLMEAQRVSTQKHTQTVKRPARSGPGQPARNREGCPDPNTVKSNNPKSKHSEIKQARFASNFPPQGHFR